MELPRSDILAIIGIAITIILFFVRDSQRLKKTVKKLELSNKRLNDEIRDRCERNVRDVVNQVGSINISLGRACTEIQHICSQNPSGRCTKLVSYVHEANGQIGGMIGFCERLNNEYEEEFGHFVYDNIRSEIDNHICLD